MSCGSHSSLACRLHRQLLLQLILRQLAARGFFRAVPTLPTHGRTDGGGGGELFCTKTSTKNKRDPSCWGPPNLPARPPTLIEQGRGGRRETCAGYSMNIHRLIEPPAQEMNANSGGTKGINSASLQIEPSVVMRGDGKSDVEVGRVGVE